MTQANGYPAYPQHVAPQPGVPAPQPYPAYPQAAQHVAPQPGVPAPQPQPQPQPYPAYPQAAQHVAPQQAAQGAPAPYAAYGGAPVAQGGLTPAELAAMANVDPNGERLPTLPIGQHVVTYESHEVVTLQDGKRMLVAEFACEQSTVASAVGGRFKTIEFIDTDYKANSGVERQWAKVASLCKALLGAFFDANWAQEMLVSPYETPKLNGAKYQVTTVQKVVKGVAKVDKTGAPVTHDSFTRIG